MIPCCGVRARASGRKLGRPKGSLGVSRLDGKEDEISRACQYTDAGEDQGQARAGVHLVVDLSGADAASLPVVDGPRQGVELLDLEEAPPHLGSQFRLGHVQQHERGLQRAAELPVGGVEAVRGLEAVEPLRVVCGPAGGGDAVLDPAGICATTSRRRPR